MDILKIASDTVDKFNMISANDRVLISVSGGPDSVFLTLFLSGLAEKYKIRLFAFHLDHLTREGDSTRDAEFVRDFCSDLSIPLFTEKIDSAGWCRERKMNFQEGARLLRKDFLDKYALENNIDKIALAHNADDLAETFIINMLRGSSLKGISAIRPYSGKIIRPLVYIYKKDILSYLDENDINYCTDYTNLKEDYLRNKIRISLIPFIQENFRKDIKKKILKIAEAAGEADEFIEKITQNTFIDMLSENNSFKEIKTTGILKLDIGSFLALDEIIKKRIILSAIDLLKGDKRDIGERKIKDILRIITNAKPSALDISKNLKISVSGGFIYFFDTAKIGPDRLSASLSEGLYKNFLGKEIKEKEIVVFDDKDLEKLDSNKNILKKNLEKYNISFEFRLASSRNTDIGRLKSLPENEAMFDLSEIAFPLKLRSWREGDYFKPFGEKYRKKLHDFFIDIKLPKECRRFVPLISDSERILWVFSFRTSDVVRIKETSDKILHVKACIGK
jgi:tRNA(Ile)-lysidine synthase